MTVALKLTPVAVLLSLTLTGCLSTQDPNLNAKASQIGAQAVSSAADVASDSIGDIASSSASDAVRSMASDVLPPSTSRKAGAVAGDTASSLFDSVVGSLFGSDEASGEKENER